METRTASLRQSDTAICMPARGKSDIYLKSIHSTVFKTAKLIQPQLVIRKCCQEYPSTLVEYLSRRKPYYSYSRSRKKLYNHSVNKVVPNQLLFYKPRKGKFKVITESVLGSFVYQYLLAATDKRRKKWKSGQIIKQDQKERMHLCRYKSEKHVTLCGLTGKNQNMKYFHEHTRSNTKFLHPLFSALEQLLHSLAGKESSQKVTLRRLECLSAFFAQVVTKG